MRIHFDDLTAVHGLTANALSAWGADIDTLTGHFDTLVSLDDLRGRSAEQLKSYVTEVHGTLLTALQALMGEYQTQFLLYKDGWFAIDDNLHAVLDTDVLDDLNTKVDAYLPDLDNIEQRVGAVHSDIADLLSAAKPDANPSVDGFYSLGRDLERAHDEVGEYDAHCSEHSLDMFFTLLRDFTTLVRSYHDGHQISILQYQSGAIAENPAAVSTVENIIAMQERWQNLEADITAAATRDQERWEELEAEAAQERTDQGLWSGVGAVAAVLVGGAAIVFTAGAATPLVVAGLAFGGASIAYGASNLVEASQDVYYGFLQGDAFTQAFNPIRDTVFMGNQQAWDIFGQTAIIGASMVIPFALALRGGQQVAGAATAGLRTGAWEVGIDQVYSRYGAVAVAALATNLGASERAASYIAMAGAMVLPGVRNKPSPNPRANSIDPHATKQLPDDAQNPVSRTDSIDPYAPSPPPGSAHRVDTTKPITVQGERISTQASNLDKASFAERVADVVLTRLGWQKISIDKHPNTPGLDGIYTKNGQTLIVETKFWRSRLSRTPDGRQGGTTWVTNEDPKTGLTRIDKSLADEHQHLSRQIREGVLAGEVKVIVIRVSPTGIVRIRVLDELGYVKGNIQLD